MAPRGGPPQGDLFGEAVESRLTRQRPLAARMRPESLDEVVGQAALLGPEGALRRAMGLFARRCDGAPTDPQRTPAASSASAFNKALLPRHPTAVRRSPG